jgi:hypothetical protein
MARFRIGITRDVLDASGEPTFGTAHLKLLERPELEWDLCDRARSDIAITSLKGSFCGEFSRTRRFGQAKRRWCITR